MNFLIKIAIIFVFLLAFSQKTTLVFAQVAESSCVITKVGNPPGPFPAANQECSTGGRTGVVCQSSLSKHDCAYKHIIDYTYLCCRWNGVHLGVDLIAPRTTPQYALEDVTIIRNNFNGCVRPDIGYSGPGSRVCTRADDNPEGQRWYHGNSTGWRIKAKGIKSKRYYDYFHMFKQSPRTEGSIVKAGEIIGYTGRTGHSPGPPHLHLQVSLPNCLDCWRNPDVMLQNYPNL